MTKKDIPLNELIKPLKKYLDKKDLVELCVNKEHEIVLQDLKGEWTYKNDKAITKQLFQDLGSFLADRSGQDFGHKTPIFSGNLPQYDYRIQINIGAMVESGLAVAIRVSKALKLKLNSWMEEEEAAQLSQLIIEGKTMLICAGTGCGKTTLMNAMLEHIPLDKRIVTLQDTPELVLPHRNVCNLIKSKTNTDIAGLKYKHYMNSITRLTPDRILLGEIDTDNTLAFLNLSNSGHSGSISTIHAETPRQALNRLCNNILMSGETNASAESIMRFALDVIDYFVLVTKTNTPQGRVFRARLVASKEIENEL